jgi:hypothetical protein
MILSSVKLPENEYDDERFIQITASKMAGVLSFASPLKSSAHHLIECTQFVMGRLKYEFQ